MAGVPLTVSSTLPDTHSLTPTHRERHSREGTTHQQHRLVVDERLPQRGVVRAHAAQLGVARLALRPQRLCHLARLLQRRTLALQHAFLGVSALQLLAVAPAQVAHRAFFRLQLLPLQRDGLTLAIHLRTDRLHLRLLLSQLAPRVLLPPHRDRRTLLRAQYAVPFPLVCPRDATATERGPHGGMNYTCRKV